MLISSQSLPLMRIKLLKEKNFQLIKNTKKLI